MICKLKLQRSVEHGVLVHGLTQPSLGPLRLEHVAAVGHHEPDSRKVKYVEGTCSYRIVEYKRDGCVL